MGNGLRHCLGCVLPCGALDLIRVVHLNGKVQEFCPPLTAGEILKANPAHVLTTPSSDHSPLLRRVNVLSPESHLRRGAIYFLIPAAAAATANIDNPGHHRKTTAKRSTSTSSGDDLTTRRVEDVIVFKKAKPSRRDRRSSPACGGAWRPHLHSISEDH